MARSVLDLLDDVCSLGDADVRFLPTGESYTPSDIGLSAYSAARWLQGLSDDGGAIGVILVSSFDALAVAYGAWLAGLTLVSLPHPARGVVPDEYLSSIEHMCEMAGANLLVIDRAYESLLPREPRIPLFHFDDYRGSAMTKSPREGGGFLQFTSGSSFDPKGVLISLDALSVAISGCVEVMEPREEEIGVSWLPLSHDMGFVGVALAALCSSAPPWNTRGSLTLISPEAFLLDPGIWLRTLSDMHATFTAAPGFALSLASRLLRSMGSALDFSSLRVLSLGAEPIRKDVLYRFSEAARPHGFDELAFNPGYGLAEATLGVSSLRPSEIWKVESFVDPGLTSSGNDSSSDGMAGAFSIEAVCCGRPFPGTSVRIVGASRDGEVGEIEVLSPSAMTRYLGDHPSPFSADGWIATGDLGALRDGEIYVIGRKDDVIVIAGRNLAPEPIEAEAEKNPVVRPGLCAAVGDADGSYAVVAEARITNTAKLAEAERSIRTALAGNFGIGPKRVVFVESGSLPKTPSGKLRRKEIARRLSFDELIGSAGRKVGQGSR